MKKIYSSKIVFLFVLLFSFQYVNAINLNVSGNISANTIWNVDTVKVTADIIVDPGVTLMIDAGTYVQLQGDYVINVKGFIRANGTIDNKITFSVLDTNTKWKGIRFEHSSSYVYENTESVLNHCIISYGDASGGDYFHNSGGAICIISRDNIIISNCFISNNKADYGGSIYIESSNNIKLINNIIVNNSAVSSGGGLYISSTDAQIINNTIANNKAQSRSGIYAGNFTGKIVNCIIYGNVTNGSSSQIVIYPRNYDLIYNCNIEGGYFLANNSYDSLPHFTNPSNGAGCYVDGLLADFSLMPISYLIDKGNNAAIDSLGFTKDINENYRFDNMKVDIGAYEQNTSNYVCGNITSDTIWSGNILIDCDINVNNGVTLTIKPNTNITFLSSHAINIEGRILAQGTYDSLINITAWNKSEGWKGIKFDNVSSSNDTSKIEYCKISYKRELTDNQYYYGAIYTNNFSKLLIRNNFITNNYSYKGAGISLISSDAKVVGNLIANNQSESFGGGIYLSNSAPSIINNTIVNNKTLTEQTGGGVYALSSYSSVLKNNIIYYNEDSLGNQSTGDNVLPTSGLNITYSCIQAGYGGSNNISIEPKLRYPSTQAGIGVDIEYVNYSLSKNSPCFNIGTGSLAGLNITSLDIDGNSRVQNAIVDLGCYEGLSSTNVCGVLTKNTLWNASVVNVNCDVTVPQGVKLTIAPGTKVLFNGHNKIYVDNGIINAEGTEGDTIEFISADTTIGWNGIEVTSNMYNTKDSIILSYCSFKYAKKSILTNSYLTGGALSFKMYSNIRISNCLFYRNIVTAVSSYSSGAAVSIESPGEDAYPIIENNKFIKNHGYNAIIHGYNSKQIVRNNIILNNVSDNYGIVCSYFSGLNISNNLIADNTTYKGAVCIVGKFNDNDVNINGNIINNNNSYQGGGIFITGNKALVNNNTIVSNYVSAPLLGGGIYLNDNADVKFKNNIIYGNKSVGDVLNQICLSSNDSDPKFYNNDIEGGLLSFSGSGSGVYYSGVFNNNVDVLPSFISPSANAGKSFYSDTLDWSIQQGSPLINAGNTNLSTLNLLAKDINGNPRVFNGRIDVGAIENQDPIVSPCTISEDTKWDADTIRITCDVTISNTKTLTIMPGTNVLFMGDYEILVEGNIIAKGTAAKRINFLVNDTTNFYDTTVSAGGWNGINFNSVIDILNDSSKFEYCTFSYAKAISNYYQYSNGAAMNIYNSSKILIDNCIFSNNYAGGYGGALYIESSNIKFENNIVCNNTAVYNGGGIFMDDCSFDFKNNVVVNNKGRYSAGIDLNSCELNIVNSIFWNNYKWLNNNYKSYSQIRLYSSSNTIFTNNDIQFGESKVEYGTNLSFTNILDIDPQFASPSTGAGASFDGMNADWSLKSTSPLLNKGQLGNVSTVLDINGQNRIVGDTIDIGAFEIQLTDRFIDKQPNDMSVCVGNVANLVAHVNANVNYQWQKYGVNIPNATNRILHIQSMSLADSGYYNCVMSNQYGTIGTDTIEIRPLIVPTIISSPSSTSKCLGSSVTFEAEVEGSTPITYQWYNTNGSLGSGASSQAFYQFGEDSLINKPNRYPTPFGNYYWGNKEQYLISASELTAQGLTAGDIPSLAFYVSATNSCPTLSNFILKIGSTSSTALSTTWISGLSTVYSVASYQISAGWNTFGFTSAYTWDGTSNIVIEVSSNNSSWIGNGNASVNHSITSFFSSHYYYHDNVTNIVDSTVAGFVSYKRPNIKLSGSSTASGKSSYSINSISANSASNYYLIATNTCGSNQSDGAILGINYAPILTPISASNDICEDASYTFSTTISQGTSPMTFQWFKDGDSVLTATSLTYNITTADTSNEGIYYCKANNLCGSDSTNQSILIVNEKPRITAQSSSQIVCENQSVTMYVTSMGTAPLTYQWYKGANAILGATNNTFTISTITTSDAASYYCKVSNGCASVPVSSTAIVITVNTAPSITAQTSSIDVCENSAAAFSTTYSGTSPITYQWFFGVDTIQAATNNTYTISSVTTSDVGNYYCIASNSCGNSNSNIIPLSVKTIPSIVSQSSDDTICEGLNEVFQVVVNGTNPISYQWYKNNTIIPTGVSPYLSIVSADVSDIGSYHVVASNTCGNTQSTDANLSVNSAASIISQSSDSSRCEGETMTFNVIASGTAPLQYQWYKGNTLISGANTNAYSISPLNVSDAAYYHISVSNICNSTTSNNTLLSVHSNPVVNLGNDTTLCSGGMVQLSAGYGYFCNWSNGSFNNQINVTSSGSYFVNVTDQYGCSGTSDTINITVVKPYAYQELCMVGVDSATNKNILIWEKSPGQGISYFNLYKESAVSNVWNLLGNISYDSLSVFTDISSTPNVKPERYSITVVDSCGNESARSIAHRTMHLTVNAGQNPNDWNLIWNAYEGFQPATYRIFRADSTMNFIKIDSIAGSSSYTYLFTDYGAPSGPLYYAIEIVNPNGSCGPTKANTNYNTSRSNTANNGLMPNMALAPDFTADVTSGYVPMVVGFTDLTTNGTVDSYFWSFGDGDVSTDKNPIHQYLNEGVYQVALSVTNQYGTEYITKDSYIDVLPNGIVNINENFDIKVFPNPYKGKTNIAYVLNKNTKAKIEVYNSLGKLVSTIVDEKQKAGSYNYVFSASDLGYSQGVYFLRMTLDNIVITKRLIEVK